MDKSELRAAAEEVGQWMSDEGVGSVHACSAGVEAILQKHLATVPADDGEPVTVDYVVSRWKGLPEDASVEQWHWVTDQVFLRFGEDRKWVACTPDSDLESWHEFAVIETMRQLRSLLDLLGIELKGGA
jgi:hypothetical protein